MTLAGAFDVPKNWTLMYGRGNYPEAVMIQKNGRNTLTQLPKKRR